MPIAEGADVREGRIVKDRASKRTAVKLSCEEAYPQIEFSAGSRGWLAWLKDRPPECVHLARHSPWLVKLLADTLYVRGKRMPTRESVRPEVSLCRGCFIAAVESELAAYAGTVVAFEPDADIFSQYFFVGVPDFDRTGLRPEVARAIEGRLSQRGETCSHCNRSGTWLWLSRKQVESLDETERISGAPGEWFCAEHGARTLCGAFAALREANVFYMNLPYGEGGAYVWI